MTLQLLRNKLLEGVSSLIKLAKETTWNNYSESFSYILSEIKDSDQNLLRQSRKRVKENSLKTPQSLEDILPTLQTLYDTIYDINIYIHKATKKETIIDIRYYLKSSLPIEYETTIHKNEPMFHCKILMPPYAYGTEKKFNINWEHNVLRTKWNNFLAS